MLNIIAVLGWVNHLASIMRTVVDRNWMRVYYNTKELSTILKIRWLFNYTVYHWSKLQLFLTLQYLMSQVCYVSNLFLIYAKNTNLTITSQHKYEYENLISIGILFIYFLGQKGKKKFNSKFLFEFCSLRKYLKSCLSNQAKYLQSGNSLVAYTYSNALMQYKILRCS